MCEYNFECILKTIYAQEKFEIIKKNEAHFLLYERLESKDVEIEEYDSLLFPKILRNIQDVTYSLKVF